MGVLFLEFNGYRFTTSEEDATSVLLSLVEDSLDSFLPRLTLIQMMVDLSTQISNVKDFSWFRRKVCRLRNSRSSLPSNIPHSCPVASDGGILEYSSRLLFLFHAHHLQRISRTLRYLGGGQHNNGIVGPSKPLHAQASGWPSTGMIAVQILPRPIMAIHPRPPLDGGTGLQSQL
jgi:hypothetical protein